MDEFDYRRLCAEPTVIQAALLIAGLNPSGYAYAMNWQEHERPGNFPAAFAALSHAGLNGRIDGMYVYLMENLNP